MKITLLVLVFSLAIARGFDCSASLPRRRWQQQQQQQFGLLAAQHRSSGVSVFPPTGLGSQERRTRQQRREPACRGVSSSSCALQASASTEGRERDRAVASSSNGDDAGVLLGGQDFGVFPQGNSRPFRSTLGVDRHVLQHTIVPGFAGAVIKESPLDFIVVEIPKQQAAKFTPADPEEPIPKRARARVIPKVPTVDAVVAAIEEWKERWGTGAAFQGSAEPPAGELEQMLWNYGKGFDVITKELGADATTQFQTWLLDVATRAAFDALEEEGGGTEGVLLPPASPTKKIYLQCPLNVGKPERTALHAAFREYMSFFFTTAIMPPRPDEPPRDFSPVPLDGHVYFEIAYEKQSRNHWPKGRGEFLEFSVYKAGRSTSEAIEVLCRCLYMKRTRVTYAGTKDSRAVTAQKMRSWRLTAETIHEAQRILSEKGIGVSDYRYTDDPLSVGGLKGNHFEITLRAPPGGWGSGEAAAAAVAANGGREVSAAEAFRRLRNEGFVNFFGEQRFGRDGTNNVDVGLLLLCSKWKLACDRIMAPHRADSPRLAEIKKLFLSGARLGQMLSNIPRSAFVERKLLTALDETGSDHLGAIMALPRETYMMFLQSYQSLLWNEAASKRMGGEFDTCMAVEGDLVLLKRGKPLTAWDTRPTDGDDNKDNDTAASERGGGRGGSRRGGGRGRGGERGGDRGGGSGRGGGRGGGGQESGEAQQQVWTVTAEEARAGAFSIKHVVLPLPGTSVEFPRHSVRSSMMTSLEQDGVREEVLEGHGLKTFDLKGAYRHVIVHPRGFSAEPERPGAEEEAEPATEEDYIAAADPADPTFDYDAAMAAKYAAMNAATAVDVRRAVSIGAVRDSEGGMAPPTTAAYLRARFRREIKRRFRGGGAASGEVGGGAGNGTGRTTAIRVSFSLPLGSYATSLLQHITGDGLDGIVKPWHSSSSSSSTAGAGEQEADGEGLLEEGGQHEG